MPEEYHWPWTNLGNFWARRLLDFTGSINGYSKPIQKWIIFKSLYDLRQTKFPCYLLVPVDRFLFLPTKNLAREVPDPLLGTGDRGRRVSASSTCARPVSSLSVPTPADIQADRFPKAYRTLHSSHNSSSQGCWGKIILPALKEIKLCFGRKTNYNLKVW